MNLPANSDVDHSDVDQDLRKRLETLLQPHGQLHVLQFWDDLDPPQQQALADQVESIDLELIDRLSNTVSDSDHWEELAHRAEVPPAITLDQFEDSESYREVRKIGEQAIADGQVGMILVAGGQGSRLGFHHPKGMYQIGPISNRTLFQMHFDLLHARATQFASRIPLFIMTSPPTHDETIEFLQSHEYFGYPAEDVTIFCQGTMPAVDDDGKLLMKTRGRIFVSPDGHGGALKALSEQGCLDQMASRGIRHVFYGQVDNPLLQICDPGLIGFHIRDRSELTSQVVRKTDPLQKVGNVVSVDGVVQIIEYSDLPKAAARQTDADGKLKLWAGSIAVHVFDLEFLVRCSQSPESLPFHHARKKVAFLDPSGQRVEPETPNATKFERFIFDLLPNAKHAIVCEVDPAKGFCAVKNAPPATAETPDHVRQAIVDLHTRWMQTAGVAVPTGTPVEINPRFAVDATQLAERIPADFKIDGPTYLA